MDSNRRIAVVAGVLFIIATLAGLVGDLVLLRPILDAPDYLTEIAANEGQVLLGALFMFIAAVACPGIALALYPVLRKHDEGLALGSVGFRLIEGALYVLAAVCVLMLVTLSQESAKAGTPGSAVFQAQADLVTAARHWLGTPGAVLTFGLGALMYYWVFYRSRLIPRWLSVWGLVAVAMVMLAGVLVMLGLAEPMSTTQVVLALPVFLQEMVLAVWLIAKGFDPAAIAAEPSGEASSRRVTAKTEPATT
jgi:hypothetical protein